MDEMIDYTGDPNAVLCHFDKNHDPNNGRFASSAAKTLAYRIYKDAASRVQKIEDDVKSAVGKTSAKMYGLQYKQKTLESIQRKIDTDAEVKGITRNEAANTIKDAIRFTTVSDDGDFVGNYKELKYNLAKRGYEEVRCKNYFDLYRQGKAKDKKTVLYEEVRKPGVSKERETEIIRQMEQLAETVNDPKDIYDIKSYG